MQFNNNQMLKIIVDGINMWESEKGQSVQDYFGITPRKLLETMFGISYGESGFESTALGDHKDSKGLFQIYDLHFTPKGILAGRKDEIFQAGNEAMQAYGAMKVMEDALNVGKTMFEPWTVWLHQDDATKDVTADYDQDKSTPDTLPTDKRVQQSRDDFKEGLSRLNAVTTAFKGVYAPYAPIVDNIPQDNTIASEPVGFQPSASAARENIVTGFTDTPATKSPSFQGRTTSANVFGEPAFEGTVFDFDAVGNIVGLRPDYQNETIISAQQRHTNLAFQDIARNLMRVNGISPDIYNKPDSEQFQLIRQLMLIPAPSEDGLPQAIEILEPDAEWRAKATPFNLHNMRILESRYYLNSDGSFIRNLPREQQYGIGREDLINRYPNVYNLYKQRIDSGHYAVTPLSGGYLQIQNLNDLQDKQIINSDGYVISDDQYAEATMNTVLIGPDGKTTWGNPVDNPGSLPVNTFLDIRRQEEIELQNRLDYDLELAESRADQFYNAANLAESGRQSDNQNILTAFANAEAARANDLNALAALQTEQRQTLESIFTAMQEPADVLAASFALTGDVSPLGELTMADKVNAFVNRYVQNSNEIKTRLGRAATYDDITGKMDANQFQAFNPYAGGGVLGDPSLIPQPTEAGVEPTTGEPSAWTQPPDTGRGPDVGRVLQTPEKIDESPDVPTGTGVTPDTAAELKKELQDALAEKERLQKLLDESSDLPPGTGLTREQSEANAKQIAAREAQLQSRIDLDVDADDDVTRDVGPLRTYDDQPKHFGMTPRDIFDSQGGFNPNAFHLSSDYVSGMNISHMTGGAFTTPEAYMAALRAARNRFRITGDPVQLIGKMNKDWKFETKGPFNPETQKFDWQDDLDASAAASSEFWIPQNNRGGVNLGNPIIVGDSNDGTENEELVMSLNGAPMVVLPLDENQQRIMARANRFIPRAQDGFPDNPTAADIENRDKQIAEAAALAAQGQAGSVGINKPFVSLGDVPEGLSGTDAMNWMAAQNPYTDASSGGYTDITDPTGEFRILQQINMGGTADNLAQYDPTGEMRYRAWQLLNPDNPQGAISTGPSSTFRTGGYNTADYTIGGQRRKTATTVSNATAGVNGSAGTSASDLFSLPGFSGNMTQEQIQERSDMLTPPRARAVTSGGLRTSPEGGYRFRPDQQTRFGALGPQFAVPTPGYLSSLSENERAFLKSNLATRNVFLKDVEQDAKRRFGFTGARSGRRRFS